VVVVVVEIVVVVVVETVVVVVGETVVVIVVDSAGVVVLLTHSSGQPKLVRSSSNNSKQSVGHWFVFSVVEFGVSDVEKVVVKVVVDVEEVVVKGVVDVEVLVFNVVVSKQSAGHPSGCWHLHSQLL